MSNQNPHVESGNSPPKSSRHRRLQQRAYETARCDMLAAFHTRDCGVLIPRSDPIATAVHEAAHCVFHEAFGVTVDWATCIPDLSRAELGHVHSNANLVPLPGVLHVIGELAGDLAERPFITHEPFNARTAFISGTDTQILMRFLQDGGWKRSDYVAVYLSLAHVCLALIRQSQHWIKAVAVLLYASKTAQGAAIRKVLRANGFYCEENPLVRFKACVMQEAARDSQQLSTMTGKHYDAPPKAAAYQKVMQFTEASPTSAGL